MDNISRSHLFRVLTGKIHSGKITAGEPLKVIDIDGKFIEEGNELYFLLSALGKVTKVMARSGLEKITLQEAVAGDIIGLAGFPTAPVTSTVCSHEVATPIKVTLEQI